jgi:DNA-binding Lrp family transcriptional regulator
MTQARIIQALQNGPLTSKEVSELTGMHPNTVLSTAKKLRYQGKLTTEQVKIGSRWLAKYTLSEDLIEKKPEVTWDKNNPFDWRNAKGIFTPNEYRTMQAQAKQLYKGNPYFTNGISNNQRI